MAPDDAQNLAIPGAIAPSGRRPVQDVAEPTCKIAQVLEQSPIIPKLYIIQHKTHETWTVTKAY